MNCSKCGKKILDENSSFCAYCGVPLDSESRSSDSIAPGILAIVAAAFSIAAAAIGINNYQTYIAYYSQYGYTAAEFLGFLLFGIFALVASIFGFAAGVLSLAKKRFKFAVLGTVLLVASAVFSLAVIWRYGYGYGEYIMLSVFPTLALSLISTFFLVKSKSAFLEYTNIAEPSDGQSESLDNLS
ncbi:MAG: zinc-ribbon domain-containing protein [Candidatus Bathyarchaeota archaeon]|nr:zinc-ribbon domain-containing protein [Candidatus Bathyarchaeota archaeon]